MFCPNCGKELNDNVNFCDACGTNLTDVRAENNENIVVAKLKELLSSKLMLVIAILLSCAVVFSFGISEQSQVQNITEYDYGFSDKYFDYDGDYYHDYDDSYSYQENAELATGNIWIVLSTIGAWLVYAAAKSKKSGMKTAPFTYFKVCNLVVFILMTVLFSLAAVASLLILAFSSDPNVAAEIMKEFYQSSGSILAEFGWIDGNMIMSLVTTAMIICSVLFAGMIVLEIFIYLKAKKTIIGLRDVVTKGEPTNNISPFIAVWCFIGGGSVALSSLNMMKSVFALGISNLCYAVSLILMGVLLIKLRREMTYFVPVQEGPVLAEQPQQQNQLEEQISE